MCLKCRVQGQSFCSASASELPTPFRFSCFPIIPFYLHLSRHSISLKCRKCPAKFQRFSLLWEMPGGRVNHSVVSRFTFPFYFFHFNSFPSLFPFLSNKKKSLTRSALSLDDLSLSFFFFYTTNCLYYLHFAGFSLPK